MKRQADYIVTITYDDDRHSPEQIDALAGPIFNALEESFAKHDLEAETVFDQDEPSS